MKFIMYWVRFENGEYKFIESNEMVEKWPLVAINFLEPRLQRCKNNSISLTRAMKMKSENAGFSEFFEITLLRSVPLDKMLITWKPSKIIKRRITEQVPASHENHNRINQRRNTLCGLTFNSAVTSTPKHQRSNEFEAALMDTSFMDTSFMDTSFMDTDTSFSELFQYLSIDEKRESVKKVLDFE